MMAKLTRKNKQNEPIVGEKVIMMNYFIHSHTIDCLL